MDSPVPGSPDEWFVTEDGRQHGPYSIATLRSMVANDYFGPQALVWDDQQWVKLRSFLDGSSGLGAGRVDPHVEEPVSGQAAHHSGGLVNLEIVEDESGPREEAADAPDVPDVPDAPDAPVAPLAEDAGGVSVDAPAPERDRIVLIGRRAAGKTVYLAKLYEKLWQGTPELNMKALSGPVHRSIMHVVDTLNKGEWPPATIASMHLEMEVHHQGERQVMLALDYAGEMFRKAFLDEQTDQREVQELLAHIDRAAAVIVLVDPAVMVGDDVDAIADDDFGIVQAVQRIRRWPGGDEVPVVLVLTKFDQNKQLLDSYRTKSNFVAQHFPALHRTLKKVMIFAVSAVQAHEAADGRFLPRKDSVPVDVEAPLIYCLKAISAARQRDEAADRERAEQENVARMVRQAEVAERRRQITFAALVAGLIFVAACIIVLIVVFKG